MNKDYDQLLNINTSNQGAIQNNSPHYHHYEATPYPMVHALFEAYRLKQTDHFVDIGCGKGRLLFYVHHLFQADVTGIDMNESLYDEAIKNKQRYVDKTSAIPNSIQITCCPAEDYEVKPGENIFYFFNPFSITIFKQVIHNIIHSTQQHPRKVDVIMYYPKQVYIDYLAKNTAFEFVQKIKVPGLYTINNEERFLVFRFEAKK